MKTRTLLLALIVLITGACKTLNVGVEQKQRDESLYRQSIENAIYPEASKVDTNLVPVTKQNQHLVWKNIGGQDYVLVVTWKQNISYYKPYLDSAAYNTGSYPIWVTTAPELLERMKHEKYRNANHRLLQLLGLPPNAVYSYFVEFWVKPADLFRQCPD